MNAGTQQIRICPDRQKTKIIATLGQPPESHERGIRDLNRQEVQDPTGNTVINCFFEQSVDVIRINLAHIELEQVRERFKAIKEAILEAETNENCKRQIGLLVDLPGPKIRFKSNWWRVPTETLTVAFDDTNETLVHLDPRPTRTAGSLPAAPPASTASLVLGNEAFAKAQPEAVDYIVSQVGKQLEAGNHPLAFIGDGDATLDVASLSDRMLVCNVIDVKPEHRIIGEAKGFTIRGIPTPIDAFTEQDKDKLSTLLSADREKGPRIVSYIGVSFCQTREDARRVLYHIIQEMRTANATDKQDLSELLRQAPLLIAKIETGKGVAYIKDILDFADGAMIARGDLALNIDIVRLPGESRKIIDCCRLRGKLVITATQMLESMMTNIECNRPESVGVFQAVMDGSDVLMLSDETSRGMYLAQTIQKMQDLAKKAETALGEEKSEDQRIEDSFKKVREFDKGVDEFRRRWDDIVNEYDSLCDQSVINDDEKEFVRQFADIKRAQLRGQESTDRITHAACLMSVEKRVRTIVAPTTSGRTARMLVRFRPAVWIHAQPIDDFVGRKLAMDWGVTVGGPIPVKRGSVDPSSLMISSKDAIEETDELTGDAAIFVCGTPLGEVGTTNLIQRWDPIQKKEKKK